MSESPTPLRPLARKPAPVLRTLGFVLVAAGIAGCFSPLIIGWWQIAGLGAVDASMALAVAGWLLIILAAVRHRRLRR